MKIFMNSPTRCHFIVWNIDLSGRKTITNIHATQSWMLLDPIEKIDHFLIHMFFFCFTIKKVGGGGIHSSTCGMQQGMVEFAG